MMNRITYREVRITNRNRGGIPSGVDPSSYPREDERMAQLDERMFPNTGHGHVRPRADGMKARCGGPAICGVCSIEKARVNSRVDQFPTNEIPHGSEGPIIPQQDDPRTALGSIRLYLIKYRNAELAGGNFASSVELSHLIAAIAQGCFTQVKDYTPSPD